MQRQKRDLVILLVLQTFALVISMVLGHPDSKVSSTVVFPLMLIDLTFLQFLLYRVTAGYTKTRFFKIFFAALFFIQFILNGIANREIPLAESFIAGNFAYPLSAITFGITLVFIIQDMFANKHETTYSLLAASNAYLLIATVFGYLYSLIVLHNPGMLDIEVNTGQRLVQRTFEISHYVVAGYDVPDGVGGMLKNLTVVEAFVANLYIIFVVGRLMANQK